MPELIIKTPRMSLHRSLVLLILLLVVGVGSGTSFLWLHRDNSDGLKAIVGPVSGFTAYYFKNGIIPDSYTVDKTQSSFNNNILELTLSNPIGTTLVLTEQPKPSSLQTSSLFETGTAIRGVPGQAGVTTVEGRVVGTYVPYAHQTLILMNNSSGTANTGDVTDLIHALTPVQD